MAFDGFTVAALTSELSEQLTGVRFSNSIRMTRSRPYWEMSVIRAPLRCFRSNMQKFGAVRGDAFGFSVR